MKRSLSSLFFLSFQLMVVARPIRTMKIISNPYACAFCQETFPNASALVSHVQIKHPPVKLCNKEKDGKDTNIQDKPSVVKSKKAAIDQNLLSNLVG